MNALISRWKAAVKEANVSVEDLEADDNLTNRLLDCLSGILDETDALATRRGSHILNSPDILLSSAFTTSTDEARESEKLDIINEIDEDSETLKDDKKEELIDVPSSSTVESSSTSQVPTGHRAFVHIELLRADINPNVTYIFGDDEDVSDVTFYMAEAGHRSIRFAPIHTLVKWLTHTKFPNLNIRFDLLLTYRSFTTAENLLKLLIQRYFIPIPAGLKPTEITDFKSKTVTPIRIKVFAVIKYWLEDFFDDFRENPKCTSLLHDFLRYLLLKESRDRWTKTSALQLQGIVQKNLRGGEVFSNKQVHLLGGGAVGSKPSLSNQGSAKIEPKVPRGGLDLELLMPNKREALGGFFHMHPKEIAMQLSLIEFEMLRKIHTRELLANNWGVKNKVKVPHVFAMVSFFDRIAFFAANQIVTRKKLDDRIVVLEQLIKIAQECLEMNNFDSSYSIISGLLLPSILRLTDTWAGLALNSPNTMKLFNDMKELYKTDKNFSNLREALKNALVPCVPYMGLFLKDLTVISERSFKEMKEKAASDDLLIDFAAKSEQAELISRIKQFQQSAFSFESVPVLQQFLKNCELTTAADIQEKSLLILVYKGERECLS